MYNFLKRCYVLLGHHGSTHIAFFFKNICEISGLIFFSKSYFFIFKYFLQLLFCNKSFKKYFPTNSQAQVFLLYTLKQTTKINLNRTFKLTHLYPDESKLIVRMLWGSRSRIPIAASYQFSCWGEWCILSYFILNMWRQTAIRMYIFKEYTWNYI